MRLMSRSVYFIFLFVIVHSQNQDEFLADWNTLNANLGQGYDTLSSMINSVLNYNINYFDLKNDKSYHQNMNQLKQMSIYLDDNTKQKISELDAALRMRLAQMDLCLRKSEKYYQDQIAADIQDLENIQARLIELRNRNCHLKVDAQSCFAEVKLAIPAIHQQFSLANQKLMLSVQQEVLPMVSQQRTACYEEYNTQISLLNEQVMRLLTKIFFHLSTSQ